MNKIVIFNLKPGHRLLSFRPEADRIRNRKQRRRNRTDNKRPKSTRYQANSSTWPYNFCCFQIIDYYEKMFIKSSSITRATKRPPTFVLLGRSAE